MECNEVFFNELCLKNKTLSFDIWKTLIHAKSALGNVGFTVCRLSNADYAQLMDSSNQEKIEQMNRKPEL